MFVINISLDELILKFAGKVVHEVVDSLADGIGASNYGTEMD